MSDEEERATPEQRKAIDAAKAQLDIAVQVYYSEASRIWENDNPGMLMGWVLGMSCAKMEDDDEFNMLQIESSPGLNNFTARGIADSAAEAFAAQAYGD